MSERDKLIALIKENETIKRYKTLEMHMNQDSRIKSKISQLKTVQKQLINAKAMDKPKTVAKCQETYDQILLEIEDYPMMTEYLDLQGEINQLLKEIIKIIENEINNEIEKA